MKEVSYKKQLLIVSVAVVLLAAVFLYNKKWRDTAFPSPPVVPQIKAKVLDGAQLPDYFPAQIPLEKNAKITQNYQKTLADGSVQLARGFVTSATLDDNFKIYQNFLDQDGWKRIPGGIINQEKFKSFSSTKDNVLLQIVIQENPATREKTVNIIVTFSSRPF